MRGYYYRDFGVEHGAEDEKVQARLRLDQMRRALREASGVCRGAPPDAAEPAPVTGQILEDGDPAGEGARVIDGDALDGERQAASVWSNVKLKPETMRRPKRR
ncbi:hypothetical protein SAMN05421666_1397 [Roseovarius nanhaiticus]|uniref:Uncharacterized protein n=1 Tax=Roseovarius nanhaiticus TaxID=573024 RepID=A0A1N7FV44_9RHOB|nr:hypothetical protein [Roseovarius nanhaiticus]SEK44648.1 hypothetical protein SAMN05216208_0739 [Roseovarius nanhaiticus]SIS04169.1 hypothetical protein SAMN05421666_1397 [Roseovarius nanhaiticus]